MKKSAYIYPNVSIERLQSKNPYIYNLKSSLKKGGFTINQRVAKFAFPDLLIKSIGSDAIFLNWIEDLPARRYGKLQTKVFLLYIDLLKKLGKKIIWIKHNKLSHDKRKFDDKLKLQYALKKNADFIIAHSSDTGFSDSKIVFIHHPNDAVKASQVAADSTSDEWQSPKIDLLLWGGISPYKGILEFLNYVKTDDYLRTLNITIVGKCHDLAYFNELEKSKTANITLLNKFVNDDERIEFFRQTRFILFTYKKDSVMSSGCLIDSLIAGKLIIGPNCGAFADIASVETFVKTFDDFSQINDIVKKRYEQYTLPLSSVERFLTDNSWDNFGNKIFNIIYGKN